MGDHISGSALNKVRHLIGLQVYIRLVTFVLNLCIARHISKEIYGLAEMNLYLVYTTVLFLSREGLRRSVIRFKTKEPQNIQDARIINAGWCTLPLALILSFIVPFVFGFADTQTSNADNRFRADYVSALMLCSISAVIEMISEPFFLMLQVRLIVRVRVFIEGAATLLKCVVTYYLIAYTRHTIMAFAWAQVVFSTVVTVSYIAYFLQKIAPLSNKDVTFHERMGFMFPKWSIPPAEESLYLLAVRFTVQSFVKFALTEGEKYIMVFINRSTSDQGVYSLVQNLGSLILRFFFQPLEESANAEFSLLLNDPDSNEERAKKRKTDASHILILLLKLVTLVGLLGVSFGPNYSFVALDVLYGKQWSNSDAPSLLSWYCGYLLILGVNGITEAFIFSVIPNDELLRYNGILSLFTGVYLACSFFFLRVLHLGPLGMIFANTINMLFRVSWSVNFITKYSRKFPAVRISAWSCIPSMKILCLLAVSSIVTRFSFTFLEINHCEGSIICYMPHVSVAIICLLIIVGAILLFERNFVNSLWKTLIAKKK
eukprot:962689_1